MSRPTVGDLKKLIKGLPNDMPLFEADNDGGYYDGDLPHVKRIALDSAPTVGGYYGPHDDADGQSYKGRKKASHTIVDGLVFGEPS